MRNEQRASARIEEHPCEARERLCFFGATGSRVAGREDHPIGVKFKTGNLRCFNNAGALFAVRQVTEDGLECTFALNHMAYFVVTEGLTNRLVAYVPACVVSSTACRQDRGWPSASLIGRLGQALSGYPPLQCRCRSRARASLRTRHQGPFHHGIRRRGGTIFRAALPSV